MHAPRRGFLRLLFVAAFVVAALSGGARPAAAASAYLDGFITSKTTGAPLANVCVTLGPPVLCTTATDANGYYKIDGFVPGPTFWVVYYNKEGYQRFEAHNVQIDANNTRLSWELTPGTATCARPEQPNTTVYLPNITKTLGGPSGWYTPFIVQNTNRFAITSLQVDFYSFSSGVLVARRDICALRPGQSFADVPNNDADLSNDAQYAVVVKSYMTDIVAVVNEHQGSGARAEAGSYVGASSGATKVSLPNIVRRFFGFVTPIIIQNVGGAPTTAEANFISFDGTRTARITRDIDPGRSQFIDPNSEPGLFDQTQYSVTVTASQPLSVIVNTHLDAPTVAAPVMYSANGIVGGADTIYGPYAVKNVAGVGQGLSTIVVQNTGTATVTPSITFTPLGGSGTTAFSGPSVAAGAAWVFDPRFTNGNTTLPLCGAAAAAGCLANGEYSFVASGGTGGQIAAVVNVIGDTTAAGYSARTQAATRLFLPNVTRRLGGSDGWTTPLVLQSVTATSLHLSWYKFADGSLAASQDVSITPRQSIRIDPRDVLGLANETQYAVVVDAVGGTATGIVVELNFQGGDGAMIYEGFAR
ncbi:MAG TPA: carboxypeptidase-like regulatory domain-containing protein [Candidatus Limnocylindria bacterium]